MIFLQDSKQGVPARARTESCYKVTATGLGKPKGAKPQAFSLGLRASELK
jgi:hypothetical protein